MGSIFSSEDYDASAHGVSANALFDEYVAGDQFQDLSGKVIAITGTSANGIGFHIAEVAIRKGAKVLLLCNRESSSSQKGTDALKALAKECKATTDIQAVTCDLQDLASVKTAADTINTIAAKHKGLDVLVCNAGVMALKDVRTKDGFEIQMQTNQLSHFVLTAGVWKSIVAASQSRGAARLVTHSSSARHGPGGDLKEEYFQKCEPGTLGGETISAWQMMGWAGPWSRYHMSKLANANFAMALHDKIEASSSLKGKIQASSADPGLASSQLQATSVKEGNMPAWMAKMIMPSGQSAADGSLPVSMAAFGAATKSGSFFLPQKGMTGPPIASVEEGLPVKKKGEPLVVSPQNKEHVWKWCEEVLDMKFDVE